MVSLQRRRRRQRRKKELSWSGWIVLRGSATRSGSCCASSSGSCSRSDSAARARTRTARPGASRSESRSRHRRIRRRGRARNGRDRFGFGRLRLWRSHYRRRRGNDGRRVRSRCLELDVLESLSGSYIARSRASSPSTCWTGAAPAKRRISLESDSRRGVNDQKQNERMSKKRGSGSLPPPLSLARYPDRRPISSFYVDG